jgi:hypothetical protein
LAKQYEPIEILGTVHFLNERSQPFEYLEMPEGITESTPEEKLERGRIAFQERGCLACHSHDQFTEMESFRAKGEIVQGPDLSGLGAKFDANRNPKGRQWLYSWIKQPELYHVRTVMPDLYLDPANELDERAMSSRFEIRWMTWSSSCWPVRRAIGRRPKERSARFPRIAWRRWTS